MNTDTNYLSSLDLKVATKNINRASAKILKSKISFGAIAFTGMSGAIIAPCLSQKLRKPLIVIRKRKRESHSSMMVEGATSARTFIIVDDFVVSGKTLLKMFEKIKSNMPNAICVGIYLYKHNKFLYINSKDMDAVSDLAYKAAKQILG